MRLMQAAAHRRCRNDPCWAELRHRTARSELSTRPPRLDAAEVHHRTPRRGTAQEVHRQWLRWVVQGRGRQRPFDAPATRVLRPRRHHPQHTHHPVRLVAGQVADVEIFPRCIKDDGRGLRLARRQRHLVRARAVVLLGRDAGLIAEALGDAVPQVRVASLDEAVQRCAELSEPGDAVLLSPACASLDMFKNFEERGRLFAAAVEALPA